MTDLQKSVNLLKEEGFTCVLCRQEETVTSNLRGVKPLVDFLKSGKDFSGFSAADKVVGKATAFLYVLLKVKSVYADVISKSALQTLVKFGVEASFGRLVENISNRQNDGICPFESVCLPIETPDEAFKAIKSKMKELKIS